MNIKEIEIEIDKIDEIKDWSIKLIKMKEIKEKINNEKIKINHLLETINSNEVKKNKKKKGLTLDELLKEFDGCNNLDEKAKLFVHIQALIKESELELFDEMV